MDGVPPRTLFRRTAMTLLRHAEPTAASLLRHFGGLVPALAHRHDELVLRQNMRRHLGYNPDLKNPLTYNEKLGRRIIYDRNPLIPLTTDKVTAREYVAAKRPDIVIPVYGIYDSVQEIDWAALPDSFVLKAAHGCGMNIIVRDKAAEDRDDVLRRASEWLGQNYYEVYREWAYRSIPRRLIVEQLLLDENGEIPADFKFLVFHGRVELIRVHGGRFGEHRVNFFDRDVKPVAVRQIFEEDPNYSPPPALASLIPLAEVLAEDFDYARIDLYLVGDKPWFGEITHNDGTAGIPFTPREFDRKLGDLWTLPATL
jgi:hypothetical protein